MNIFFTPEATNVSIKTPDYNEESTSLPLPVGPPSPASSQISLTRSRTEYPIGVKQTAAFSSELKDRYKNKAKSPRTVIGRPGTKTTRDRNPVVKSQDIGRPGTRTTRDTNPVVKSRDIGRPASKTTRNRNPVVKSRDIGRPGTKTTGDRNMVVNSRDIGRPGTETTRDKNPVVKSREIGRPGTKTTRNRNPVVKSRDIGRPGTKTTRDTNPVVKSRDIGRPGSKTTRNRNPVVKSWDIGGPGAKTTGDRNPVINSRGKRGGAGESYSSGVSHNIGIINTPTLFSRECICAHNHIRRAYGTPSLKWSAALATEAQSFANELALGQTVTETQNRKGGENVHISKGIVDLSTSCPTAVDRWLDEGKKYDYTKPGLTSQTGLLPKYV